jgi:hypothetical protein
LKIKFQNYAPGIHGDQMTHLDPNLASCSVSSNGFGFTTTNGVNSAVLANECMVTGERMYSLNENRRRHIVGRSQIDQQSGKIKTRNSHFYLKD